MLGELDECGGVSLGGLACILLPQPCVSSYSCQKKTLCSWLSSHCRVCSPMILKLFSTSLVQCPNLFQKQEWWLGLYARQLHLKRKMQDLLEFLLTYVLLLQSHWGRGHNYGWGGKINCKAGGDFVLAVNFVNFLSFEPWGLPYFSFFSMTVQLLCPSPPSKLLFFHVQFYFLLLYSCFSFLHCSTLSSLIKILFSISPIHLFMLLSMPLKLLSSLISNIS